MSGAYHFDSNSSTHLQSPRNNASQPTRSKPYSTNHREQEDLCLVSALVIQPVLLCSVLRRFVHATGCGKHLFVIMIIIIIIIIILIIIIII